MNMPLRTSSASRELFHPRHPIALRRKRLCFPRPNQNSSLRQLQSFHYSSTSFSTCNAHTSVASPRRNDCNIFPLICSSHSLLELRNASTRSKLNYSTPSASTSSQKPTISTEQYHKLADTYIDVLVGVLEEVQEKRQDVDCEYSVCLTMSKHSCGGFLWIYQTNSVRAIGWCLNSNLSPQWYLCAQQTATQ